MPWRRGVECAVHIERSGFTHPLGKRCSQRTLSQHAKGPSQHVGNGPQSPPALAKEERNKTLPTPAKCMVPASSKKTRLLGILSEGAMKMNTFPEANMVGMEKDRLQGVDTDVDSNNCQSYEAKCCDFLLDAGYGKQDVLTHAKYCLLVLVFSAAAHLNFRLSFLQSFSKLLKHLRPAFL